MSSTTTTAKPSNINTNNHFWDTFGNFETETVARNIVIILRQNGDEWKPFTWQEYCDMCEHGVTHAEKFALDKLVGDSYFALVNGRYTVTDSFIEKLREKGYVE